RPNSTSQICSTVRVAYILARRRAGRARFPVVPPRAVLIVVAPERFRDEELIEPRRALEGAGHAVTVTSTRPGTAAGMLGAKTPIVQSLAQLDPHNFDAMYIAGGSGAPTHLWDHEPLRVFLRAMHAA